jgi:shikimate dehydrogenase
MSYGIIGKPLSHSFSKTYFEQKFEQLGLQNDYHLFEMESVSAFPKLIQTHPELEGLNVTMPYKSAIINFLDEIEPEAQEVGAVNVIKIFKLNHKIFLKGYNTDIYGFSQSLKPLLTPEHCRALVLGTGGAAKAVSYVLKCLGITVQMVSRQPQAGQLGYNDLDEPTIRKHLLIIQTTPVGMHPNPQDVLPFPFSYLTSQHCCYDLIYNPEKTEFLRRAEACGARIKNGLEMLHLQAEKAWEIWCYS